MKIAILSDVHDNIWRLETLLAGLEADALIAAFAPFRSRLTRVIEIRFDDVVAFVEKVGMRSSHLRSVDGELIVPAGGRLVGARAEAARGVVELGRGDAEIDQHAVEPGALAITSTRPSSPGIAWRSLADLNTNRF